MSTGSSFPKQLALSATIMGGLIGGLVWLGRAAQDPAAVSAIDLTGPRTALSLIPERAWLVAELDGEFGAPFPFANDPAPCSGVRAPERLVLAVVESQRSGAPPEDTSLSFLLGTPSASPDFFECAKQKILAARGRDLGETEGIRALESPSGVLTRHKDGALLFSTEPRDLNEMRALLEGRAPSLKKHTLTNHSPFSLRLELPADWLTRLEPDAERSPLHGLRGASLHLAESGGAEGVLRCQPESCERLGFFVERAFGDLLGHLPVPLRPRYMSALRLSPPDEAHAGQLRVQISPSGVELARTLLSGWLGTEATEPPSGGKSPAKIP